MKNLLQQNLFLLAIPILSMYTTLMISGCKKKIKNAAPTSVTDADGIVYGVIKIGDQYWMNENLRSTKYNDGTLISHGLNDANWASTISGAYALYNDDNANDLLYGKLYNWAAVKTGKLAPVGWHVANSSDWNKLIGTLGGSSIAGGKMKSSTTNWHVPNTGANNSSGFNGMPGGYRGTTGSYLTIGDNGYWWSSSQQNSTQADYFRLDNLSSTCFSNGATMSFGYSIRCVKD